jgi:NADH-quinone oxidoreductase subunit E
MSAAAFTAEQEKTLKAWTSYYPHPIMGILQALRQVQEWHLRVTLEDEAFIARLFETSAARVHELVTFFPFFTEKPAGRCRIGLCRGISCSMAGSGKMAAYLEKKLGVKARETTADGKFSWEEMECLGACDHAPALLVNEELKGAASEESVDRLVGEMDG